jgi:cytochrome b
MNTPSQPILVWDAPVRVFHWLLVLSFFGAYLTAESDRWRAVHVTLGYTAGGLVVFRLLWGLLGTRHARFADFVRGPQAVRRYLASLLRGVPEHHAGHNPAGALAIVALLGLTGLTVALGWATYSELGGEWLEEGHELAGNLMLLLVGVHVAAVGVASWLHRENLVHAMLTGRKLGTPQEGIRRAWRGLAVLMLVAVLGFWWLQWQDPPQALAGDRPAATAKRGHDRDHDEREDH